MNDMGHSAKSSSSYHGIRRWRSGWSRSIGQVQASDGEGKRLLVNRLDWVDT